MTAGQTEFRHLVERVDHIAVMENWYGWFCSGEFGPSSVVCFQVGPFRSKRDAVAWLSSWCVEPRPLRYSDLGSWHWRRGVSS